MIRFVGTVTDISWIKALPKDMDLREKAKMLHDVKYVDRFWECLYIWEVDNLQMNIRSFSG